MKDKVTSAVFVDTPPEYVPVEMDVYSPTRLDYIATSALRGLVTGRSEKDIRKAPVRAVELAHLLIEELDKA